MPSSESKVYHKPSKGGTTKKSLRKRNVNNSLLQKLFYTLALFLTSKRDHETIQWTCYSYIFILWFPIHFDFRTRRGTKCSEDSAKLYGVVGGEGGGGGLMLLQRITGLLVLIRHKAREHRTTASKVRYTSMADVKMSACSGRPGPQA